MEFEDQEEHEEEMCFDPMGNPTRVKIPGSVDPSPIMVSQPLTLRNTTNNNKARYRECLKNHAVTIGGHALDGCGEFMPAGAEGTLDALKCAACNCHRNFHRKETDTTSIVTASPPDPFLLPHHPHHHHHPPPHFAAYYRSPSGYLHVAGQNHNHHRGAPLALPSTSGAGGGGGGGGGTQSTREDQEDDVSNPMSGFGPLGGDGSGSSKKRHRTKFTQEQKDKMLELAERLGWRIQKHDESVVQEFCNETGVKRHVLKVWMHNNKHTLGKKP